MSRGSVSFTCISIKRCNGLTTVCFAAVSDIRECPLSTRCRRSSLWGFGGLQSFNARVHVGDGLSDFGQVLIGRVDVVLHYRGATGEAGFEGELRFERVFPMHIRLRLLL